MDIIVYGLGGFEKIVERSLRIENNIIAYSDSFSTIEVYKGIPFIIKEKIHLLTFDYLIIAISNIEIGQEVKRELKDKYNVKEDKIIVFSVYYNRLLSQKIDKVFLNRNHEIENVVLGISHAVCGINVSYMRNCINLAVRSQDLYYNKFSFDLLCQRTDPLRIKNVIIDMYDYNYFNYDVSMLKNCVSNYYTSGGICISEHNFKLNKWFDYSFDSMLKRNNINALSSSEKDFISLLFDVRKWVEEDYSGYDEIYKNRISKNAPLPSKKFVNGIIKDRYTNTISENISVFWKLCNEISINAPNANIILVLIPRFCTMEYALEPHLREWKEEFYETIALYQSEFNYRFIDYKSNANISNNSYFYNDVNHLNDIGSKAFTSLLLNDL